MNELWQILMHADEYLVEITNANALIAYIVISAIVFLESGNLFFVFLPGDGFLFMVGVLAAAGTLSIGLVLAMMMVAAIAGYLLNYYTGKHFGKPLLRRTKWIPKKYYRKTFQFFRKYGSKAIILGRFFPIVRTFSPFLAGIGKMKIQTFYRDSILGAIIWIGSFVLIGYFFGGIPFIKENFVLLYLGLVFLTFTPIIITSLRVLFKTKKGKAQI